GRPDAPPRLGLRLRHLSGVRAARFRLAALAGARSAMTMRGHARRGHARRPPASSWPPPTPPSWPDLIRPSSSCHGTCARWTATEGAAPTQLRPTPWPAPPVMAGPVPAILFVPSHLRPMDRHPEGRTVLPVGPLHG